MSFARLPLALALSLALSLSLSLLPRTAHADERARARVAFHAGLHHYNLGEFKSALESFREAYRHYDDPSFLFNIAQCERQLGHKREAVLEYRAFLNNAAHPENAESVRQTIRQLEKELTDEDEAKRAAAAPPTHGDAPPAVALTPPPEPAPESAPALVATTPSPAERKPVYKKWWLWTIVGGVVVAGAATGVAVALTRPTPLTATTSLGVQHPF